MTGHSIRSGKYRYTEWYRNQQEKPEAFVLTDLKTDPGEESNVAADPAHAQALKRMRDELRERIAAAVAEK